METKTKLIDLFNITPVDFLSNKPVNIVYYEEGSHVGISMAISPRLNQTIADYAQKNGVGKAVVLRRLINEVNDNTVA